MSHNTFPLVRSVGLSGLLVSFGDTATDPANRAAIAFRAAVDALNWPEVVESSCSLVSAFFRVDLTEHSYARLAAKLAEIAASRDWTTAPLPAGRSVWTIPAVFGTDRAPQLAEAAEAAGMTVSEAETSLAAARLRVLTIGFAPGQPYLGTLEQAWNIPRQVGLTPLVPVGALVVAIRQICLFTRSTPTGWRHVGQTAFHGFQPDAARPTPLQPGDEVRFEAISAIELSRIESTNTDGLGEARAEVVE